MARSPVDKNNRKLALSLVPRELQALNLRLLGGGIVAVFSREISNRP
jgi:hypothetical protein